MTFNCFTHHHHFKTRIAPGAPSQTSTMPCHAYREKRSTDFFPLLSSPRPPFLVYSEHAMPGPPKHVHDDIITLQRCESDSLQPANEKKNLQKTDMVFGWSGCPRTPPHTAAPPPQNRAHRWLTRPGTHSSQNARIRACRIHASGAPPGPAGDRLFSPTVENIFNGRPRFGGHRGAHTVGRPGHRHPRRASAWQLKLTRPPRAPFLPGCLIARRARPTRSLG